MGSTALFDKSFIQSLNVDESVWFDHFFTANIRPLFYVEESKGRVPRSPYRASGEDML